LPGGNHDKRRVTFGGDSMSNYRLYCLDGIGHITSVEVIQAKDDGEAILLAESMKRAVSHEVGIGTA
jgi:hypothetical protein